MRACLVMPFTQRSARNLVIHTDIHAQLFPDDVGQGAAVPQVHPIALSAALLEVHALLCDDPVESFRSGDGGAEPDLLVRRLFVEHIAVLFGLYFEDTSLDVVSNGPLEVGTGLHTEYSTSISGSFSCASSSLSTSSFRYISASSWNSSVVIWVGVVGCSWSSLSLGAGFSASGMILLMFIDEWKGRTGVTLRATGCDAAAAPRTMPLAGDWARRGVRTARRRAAPVNRVAGLILKDDVDVCVEGMSKDNATEMQVQSSGELVPTSATLLLPAVQTMVISHSTAQHSTSHSSTRPTP